MVKKLKIVLLTLFLLLPNGTFNTVNANTNPKAVAQIYSPDGSIVVDVFNQENGMFYEVNMGETEMISNSRIGFETDTIGKFLENITFVTKETYQSNTSWKPVVGLDETIKDHYNGVLLTFEANGKQFQVDFRAYDEGVAFKYIFPDHDSSYKITKEHTRYGLPSEGKALVHNGGNQRTPDYVSTKSLGSTIEHPLTVLYPSGEALSLAEANLDGYTRSRLEHAFGSSVQIKMEGSSVIGANATGSTNRSGVYTEWEVEGSATKKSPWRVMMMGKTLEDMLLSYTLVDNLSDPADEEKYKFSEWVEPGATVRAAKKMENEYIKSVVDEAAAEGLEYVLLDTGWYGPEDDGDSDPRLDPAVLDLEHPKDQILADKFYAQPDPTTGEYTNGWIDPATGKYTGQGVFDSRGKGFHKYGDHVLGKEGTFQTDVDIPALCSYANAKGVGIILYVNNKCWPDTRNRFTTDELFSYFEKWGVAGVKPGFVRHGNQFNEAYIDELIESAARHKLVLTIHDEYVTTGQTRTFPNLFQTEGILGDEGVHSDELKEVIQTLFTRQMQGPTDHTFIWPGPGQNAKASKAFQLATSFMFRAGMPVIYWYTSPSIVVPEDLDKMDIWNHLPGTWDETKYLEASVDGYATFAKRTGSTWYLGSASAIDRTVEHSLDFLDKDKQYLATFYLDDESTIVKKSEKNSVSGDTKLLNEQWIVTSEDLFLNSYRYGTGMAATFKEATAQEIASIKHYESDIYEFVTDIKVNGTSVPNFNKITTNYTVDIPYVVGMEQPKVTVETNIPEVKYEIKGGSSLGDSKTIVVTKSSGQVIEYTIHFNYTTTNETIDYLSDLEPTKAFLHYDNHIGKDREVKNLENNGSLVDNSITGYYGGAYSGGTKVPLKLLMNDGSIKEFKKGIGVHARSGDNGYVEYDLTNKGYETFSCLVGAGRRDAKDSNMAEFEVKFFVDGKQVATTGTMEDTTGAKTITFDVSNGKKLKIEIDEKSSNSNDEINICDAKFEGNVVSDEIINDLIDEVTKYYEKIVKDASLTQENIMYMIFDNGKNAIKDSANINEALHQQSQTLNDLGYLAGEDSTILSKQKINRIIETLISKNVVETSKYTPSYNTIINEEYSKKLTEMIQANSTDQLNAIKIELPEAQYAAKSLSANQEIKLLELKEQFNAINQELLNQTEKEAIKKAYEDTISLVTNSKDIESCKKISIDYTKFVDTTNLKPEQIGEITNITISGYEVEGFNQDKTKYTLKLPYGVQETITRYQTNNQELSVVVDEAKNIADKVTIKVINKLGQIKEYVIELEVDETINTDQYLYNLGNKVGESGILELSTHKETWNIGKAYDNSEVAIKDETSKKIIYEYGIGTHANSDAKKSNVIIDITGKNYTTFETVVGCNANKTDVTNTNFTVDFYVTRDGKEQKIGTSGVITKDSAGKNVTLDIEGASKFRIHINPNGSNSADHVNFGNPIFKVGVPELETRRSEVIRLIDSLNIDSNNYTDENIKLLNDAITKTKELIKDSTNVYEIDECYYGLINLIDATPSKSSEYSDDNMSSFDHYYKDIKNWYKEYDALYHAMPEHRYNLGLSFLDAVSLKQDGQTNITVNYDKTVDVFITATKTKISQDIHAFIQEKTKNYSKLGSKLIEMNTYNVINDINDTILYSDLDQLVNYCNKIITNIKTLDQENENQYSSQEKMTLIKSLSDYIKATVSKNGSIYTLSVKQLEEYIEDTKDQEEDKIKKIDLVFEMTLNLLVSNEQSTINNHIVTFTNQEDMIKFIFTKGTEITSSSFSEEIHPEILEMIKESSKDETIVTSFTTKIDHDSKDIINVDTGIKMIPNKEYIVYHWTLDGIEKISVTKTSDGNISFETDDFSPFMITMKDTTPTNPDEGVDPDPRPDPNPTPDVEEPSTGDNSNLLGYVFIMISCLAVMLLFKKSKKIM